MGGEPEAGVCVVRPAGSARGGEEPLRQVGQGGRRLTGRSKSRVGEGTFEMYLRYRYIKGLYLLSSVSLDTSDTVSPPLPEYLS